MTKVATLKTTTRNICFLDPSAVPTHRLKDKDEKYVIVLEPLHYKDEYFLLTAYHLEGKDAARDKMVKKYKRRMPDLG